MGPLSLSLAHRARTTLVGPRVGTRSVAAGSASAGSASVATSAAPRLRMSSSRCRLGRTALTPVLLLAPSSWPHHCLSRDITAAVHVTPSSPRRRGQPIGKHRGAQTVDADAHWWRCMGRGGRGREEREGEKGRRLCRKEGEVCRWPRRVREGNEGEKGCGREP